MRAMPMRRGGRRQRVDHALGGPFETAFDVSPSGLALLDAAGVVVRANPALAALLGADAENPTGWTLARHETFAGPPAAALSGAVRDVVAGHAPGRRLDLLITRAAGDRWLHATVTSLREPIEVSSARVLVQLVEVTEQRLAQRDLDDRSRRDPLTELGNRLLLFQWLDRMAEAGAASRVSVLFCDLDRFKWINDTLGHHAGDAVLVAVAHRLRLLVRPADLVTRVGGDEFVVVLHDASSAAAVEVAQRTVAMLREPVIVDGHEIVVHGSVGVCTASSGTYDVHSLVADADTAMYRAKQAGGNRVAVFSPPMRRARERHLQTDAALRQAVRDETLELLYQPVVNLRTGQFDGVEALLRWPGGGDIQHAIAVAEESDLITLLGEWVLIRAASDAPAEMIGVNVSVRQLIRPGFADVVRRILDEAGVKPQRLCIEVTETGLADNIDTVVSALRQLREVGARVAIDDFGTGHASLTYLARFPVDIVKVDRSFVHGLGNDAASGVIVRSVAAMAHALGMTVIAEGVESLNQLEIVLEAGCDAAQGYLFSRPVPRQRCAETLANAVPWPVGFSKRRPRATSLPVTPVVEPARRYRLLLDLARDITGCLDQDEVLASTFAALRQLLTFGGGSIQLVDASGEFVRLAAADPAPTPDAYEAKIPVGQGIGGRIVASGEPRYIPDILDDPDVPTQRATSLGVRSYFGVPLITEGTVIGVLQIDSQEIDQFSEEDRFTVLAFTPIVAAAIQTARLFDREAVRALMPSQRESMDDAPAREEPAP